MLILTRRPTETVMIGDEITLTVLEVHGNQVRIGINAPTAIPILREELYHRIKAEQQRKAEAKALPQEATRALGLPKR